MSHARHLPLLLIPFALASCKPSPASEPAVDAKPKASGPKPVAKNAAPSTPVASQEATAPKFVRPKYVRGIYLTAWSAASKGKLTKMIDLIDRTELNSVVIDVRDTGEVYFPIDDPMVKRVHEMQHGTLTAFKSPKPLMERLAKAGVYPIARVACFRDNFVPKIDSSRAVQIPGGQPWHDRSKHYWLDPYDKRNWEYLAKIVDYAMDIGFPEIQLDYVRFPSEGKSSTQVFPNKAKYGDPKAHPDDVITAFAHWIGDRVHKRGRAFSADVFGIISEGKMDQGIGQTLEKIAAPFDTLSPMVYPSHFAHGEYRIANPNAEPYEIIHKSLADYKKRIPKTSIRPWLQDFSLGSPPYGAKEVRAQIKAADDLGYHEFLLWDASNRYTDKGLLKKNAVGSDQSAPSSPKPSAKPAAGA